VSEKNRAGKESGRACFIALFFQQPPPQVEINRG
jgi:hypothetical protein